VAGKKIVFDCYFDVIGRVSTHSHKCFFDVTDEEDFVVTLHTNNKEYKNATEIDFVRYGVKPVVGILQNKDKTYRNVKVEFVHANEMKSTMGNVVNEICYTDDGGRYKAYIEAGVYDIDIFINNKKISKKNVKIDKGLKYQYYKTVNGLIHKKFKDWVSFCGTDYKMVFGQLIDNKKTPIQNAEMIILDEKGNVDTYIKTDEDGKYSFAIKNGTYTVKIRSPYSPMKTTKITVDDYHGFSELLTGNSNVFNKQDMIRL
jgi:hypothetical protein